MNLKLLPISICLILVACDNGIIVSRLPDASGTRNNYVGETYNVTGLIADAGSNIAVTMSGANGIGTVRVDQDGGYAFIGVRPGRYVLTPAREGSYFVPATESIEVTKSNIVVPTFQQRTALKVTGYLNGWRFENVPIVLSQEGARDRVAFADTSHDFVFDNVLPGKYTTTPQSNKFVFDPPSYSFEIKDVDERGIVFRIIPANKSIFGKIIGATTAGVTVTAKLQNSSQEKITAVTNAAGEYFFQGLQIGAYLVTPSLGNYIFTPESVVAPVTLDDEAEFNFISSRKEIQCNGGWCTPWDVENYELVNVRGVNGQDIWTSGARSALLHYASPSANSTAAWFPTPLNTGDIVLAGIWGSGPKDVWLVGSQGTILHNLGNGWIQAPSPTEKDLFSVWGTSATSMWAVGASGTMIRYDKGAWQDATPANSTRDLNGVWAAKNGDWWAVGASGTIFKNSGTGWAQETSPTTNNLNAVWGKDDKTVWAVGDKGTILLRTDNTWKVVESGTDIDLFGVWASDTDSSVWAVGPRSTVLRYGGMAESKTPKWEKLMPPTLTLDLGDLRGVWSAGDGFIWVAGNRGIFSYRPTP